MLAALVLMIGVFQDPPATYTDGNLNLVFDYPKSWMQIKKDRRSTTWKIPIAGSSDSARFEVTRATFRSEPELWQTIQLRSAELQKRRVLRQWSQDILGVPLLCTQVEYEEKGVAKTQLDGLYYQLGESKMLVRLSSPTSAFGDLRYQLQTVLETLRSVDGTKPVADDPSKPLPVAGPKPEPARPTKVLSDGSTTDKPVIAKLSLGVKAGGKDAAIRYPEGWQTSVAEDGGITLSNAQLSGPVGVTVSSILDSPSAGSTLTRRSAASIEAFATVSLREDPVINPNRAGASVSMVWRVGKSATGDLLVLDAVCSSGEFYLTFSFRATDPKRFASDRAILTKLLEQASIIPTP